MNARLPVEAPAVLAELRFNCEANQFGGGFQAQLSSHVGRGIRNRLSGSFDGPSDLREALA